MKYLLTAALLCVSLQAASEPSSSGGVRVAQCFKVQSLLKSDEVHYWAEWSNGCPYTIDAVYVMVGFLDHARKELGNGVWPMYFVLPGIHKVNRFAAPLAGFETVSLHRITTDLTEAFAQDRATAAPGSAASKAAAVKNAPVAPRAGQAGSRTAAPQPTGGHVTMRVIGDPGVRLAPYDSRPKD